MKNKIINDPVHGFIQIPDGIIAELIAHPYFQRLRRIKQLGLTEFVYPGALHTRFHHAIGAMHLMHTALDTIAQKGTPITKQEKEAALIAILLHDIGHGPFSHALENSILENSMHEKLSLLLMQKLDDSFDGKLKLAIQIFENRYERKFFHQLVSSQLDTDRLDYLQRDCFFTGVSEGTIGGERIIKMLKVVDDQLLVEEKGVYSIEHFLNARRMMYWQVYLHKTTVSTEHMLIAIVKRARLLAQQGNTLFATPSFALFLEKSIRFQDFIKQETYLQAFLDLDDYDIWASIKVWQQHEDRILAMLCKMVLERKLFRTFIYKEKPQDTEIHKITENVKKHYQLTDKEIPFLLHQGIISNAAYQKSPQQQILIYKKNGDIVNIAQTSDLPTVHNLGIIVKKYFLSYPREVS
ncbi:MAG: HD domain-containing protein [Bernardetiaceae bacterium]|nr:HD domain-containing protein [Bernardetiaceae bacterium]